MRRPACWRPAAEAEPGEEHWSRSDARARRSGRPSPPNLRQRAGIDGRPAARGHAGRRADRRRSGAHPASPRIPEEARPAARMDLGRRDAAARAASRPAGSPARCVSPEDHQVDNRKLAAALRIAAGSGQARPSARTRRSQRHRDRGAAALTGVVLADGTQDRADVVGARRRRLVARHRGLAARLAPAGAPDQGPDAALQHGPRRAADHARDLGAGRLYGAAPRRPPARRRDRRGEGLRHDADRRRHADAAGSGVARDSRRSRNCRSTRCGSGIGPAAATMRRSSGPAPVAGLVYATGHHRNGILLAPVTADAIARCVLEGDVDPAIRPFGIERFAPRAGRGIGDDQ